MDQPKVSIIVPIYNVERYLDRCMESLVNQTLEEIEIILVDDESPDNCPAMCDQYARQDARIKVIHKKNGGLGFARNSGLEIATGEYVAFVDSDDFVSTSMFEELYMEAFTNELDVSFCNFISYKSDGTEKKIIEVDESFILQDKLRITDFLLDMVGTKPFASNDRKYRMSVWHGLYSRHLIKKYDILFRSEREIISEDIIFHIDFLKNVQKLGYITPCLYYYCENHQSLSKEFRADRFLKDKMLHEEALGMLLNAYPERETEIQNRVDRLFIGYTRRNCLWKGIRLETINSYVRDKYFNGIILRYPIYSLPIKFRIFAWLVRYKFSLGIYIINRLSNFLRVK